jgi:hypothetical protein
MVLPVQIATICHDFPGSLRVTQGHNLPDLGEHLMLSVIHSWAQTSLIDPRVSEC